MKKILFILILLLLAGFEFLQTRKDADFSHVKEIPVASDQSKIQQPTDFSDQIGTLSSSVERLSNAIQGDPVKQPTSPAKPGPKKAHSVGSERAPR